ncbi:ABC transporter substrate-binding protein [Roseomonas sp. E05]|uniref:ABC transporter substrate-binding protein n=1 Tax=Roseomonas sp. E05 TaxID=3046310 RepID=UPI0024BACF11|nr:ABC transporter substrate-binding protein [Roseomonas sp. E05]MDJ0391265.1 ABC transporter substrate-binding protein [Roseomonas sp. E05]
MSTSRRALLQGTAGLAAVLATPAIAQAPTIRIGVLADFSGIYTDLLGPGGVACARQAAAEFAPQVPGLNVEVIFGDHQNKADIGASLARRWFDQQDVDMLIAGPNSAVGLAVATISRDKDKACLGVAVTATEFTNALCTPNTINWTYDGYMLSKAVAAETVKGGGRKWYFIATDNAFGHSLQAETTAFVEQAGGSVMGGARVPLGTSDFSATLLAARSSGAQVIGLALGGNDLPSCIKQAQEFGITRQMKLAALVMFLNDIHAAGLQAMQQLLFTNSFYWDTNDQTRAFTRRVLPGMGGAYPGMVHAGCYATTLHYLKAAAALGVAQAKQSGAAVVAQMKKMPTQDDAFGSGSIRADGRAVLPAYLLQVKTPAESRREWDYCKLVSTMSPPDTVKPLEQSACPLVRT